MAVEIRSEGAAAVSSHGTQPLISVVTPFYNTAQYLEECIQSVLGQTYANFEYILFDNCSSDGSTEIAARYAAHDSRIKLLRSDTLVGQAANYNRALGQINPQSRYTKIVQADDWIFPTCLEEMTRAAVASPHVGVVGSLSVYEDNPCTIGHTGLPFSRGAVFHGREATRLWLLMEHGFLGSQTCVLYRSDLVRGSQPFFDSAYSSYTDVDACLRLLRSSDFAFVFQVLTFNRRSNPGFWDRIRNFSPGLLHRYVLMSRYGSQAMPESEFRRCYAQLQARYYRMLASGWMVRKGRQFWDFHLQALKAEGKTLSRQRLLLSLPEAALSILGRLPHAIRSRWRRLRSRRRG